MGTVEKGVHQVREKTVFTDDAALGQKTVNLASPFILCQMLKTVKNEPMHRSYSPPPNLPCQTPESPAHSRHSTLVFLADH